MRIDALNFEQQSAVYSNKPTVIVPAGPGSGKSLTLVARVVHRVHSGDNPERIVILTFTNNAARVFTERLSNHLIKVGYAGTLHGYCMRLIQDYGSLLGYRVGCVSIATESAKEELLQRISAEIAKGITAVELSARQTQRARLVWNEYEFRLKRSNMVDYDVILRDGLALLSRDSIKLLTEIDELLVDERQDSGELDTKIFWAIPARRRFFVGDIDQCQPAGTMVRMSDDSEKPIEEIAYGDSVVSYARHEKVLIKSARVTAVARRRYSGLLYTVRALSATSTCTGNHLWLIKWLSGSQRTRNHWCVYLMRKGDSFRVGKTSVFRSGSKGNEVLGLTLRMRQEGAEAGWILTTHKDQGAAIAREDVVAATYGLPQTCFKSTKWNKKYTQPVINSIFASIPNQLAKAVRCLQDHGRDISYPLFSVNQPRTRRTIQEIHACNLLDDVMQIPVYPLPYSWTLRRSTWYPISVSTRSFTGEVFSLEVERHHKYIADGLLTCNCCYGFRGARPDIFAQEAATNGYIALELNYRSDIAICNAANDLIKQNANRVPKVIRPVSQEPGQIMVKSYPYESDELYGIWSILKDESQMLHVPFDQMAVLCRTNVIAARFREVLAGLGIPVKGGRHRLLPDDWPYAISVVSLLVDPANDLHAEAVLKGMGIDAARLLAYKQITYERQCSLATAALLPNTRPATLVDGVIMIQQLGLSRESLSIIAERIKVLPENSTVSDLLVDLWNRGWQTLEETAEAKLTVTTIHGAKGSEWDVVFMVAMEEGVFPSRQSMMGVDTGPDTPSVHGSLSSGIEEERRLCFVGVTRARHRLYLTWSRKRTSFYKTTDQQPSRFLAEMENR